MEYKKSQSLSEQVADEILDMIVVKKQFKIGDKLPNETELSAVVNLVYLAARDRYRVEREDKSGKGFVDFIFYPEDRSDTCIILELKVDHTPEEAIEQIRDKDYMLRFMGKLGELPKYTGEILGVGISYSKTDKIHRCKTEILRNRI